MAKTKKFKLIGKPGFYPDVPEADYHADPVIKPSLSSGIAKLMVNRSPRHARWAHPRLNPDAEEGEENKRPMDVGSAIHKMILGQGAEIDVIDFNDYKKNDAKEARDVARANGNIPILRPDMDYVEESVKAAQEQLHDEGLGTLFTKGKAELTMVWQDRKGVWCRGRLDYFHDEAMKAPHIMVPEVKTTAGSAHPDDWKQTFFNMGYDYQTVFYERGIKALLPHVQTVEFVWIVLEQKPPYGLSVVRLGNQGIEEASALIEVSIDMWDSCMKTNKWPGYDSDNPGLDPAFWRSELKEARRLSLLNRLAFWQRPN
jgi:PDDEXK-like domain of unknown function (DUF3799)